MDKSSNPHEGFLLCIQQKIIYILFIAIGPFMSLEFIFVLADIVNGCMAIPNLIGLIGLRKEIVAETEKYFEYEQPVELVTNIEG